MPDRETLDERLTAVERALTDTDRDVSGLADAADLETRIDDLETRLADVESQLADLEASTQAVRGYVGNVRSVNRDVERRADLALAKVEQLEQSLDGDRARHDEPTRSESERSPPHRSEQTDRADRAAGGPSGDDPRWTAGSDDLHRSDSGDRTAEGRPGDRRRNGARIDDDSESDDDGGFLASLTGSL